MVSMNPNEIRIAGKMVPMDEDAIKKWAVRAGKRLVALSQMKPQLFSVGDRVIAEFDMTDMIEFGPEGHGTTIKLSEPGLKKKGELVGIGGWYGHPTFFGAKDADEAITSWKWLFDQAKVPRNDLEYDLEMVLVLGLISRGITGPEISLMMALANDLWRLNDMGVDVREKVGEVNEKITGNIRAYKRLKDKDKPQALYRVVEVMNQLSDLSAESRLALIAKNEGMKVEIGKSPDLFIDGVRVEVKFNRGRTMDAGALVNKLNKGLTQGGKLIVIRTGDFGKKRLVGVRLTWLPIQQVTNILEMGLKAVKNGRKCILLYTGTNKGYIGRLVLMN